MSGHIRAGLRGALVFASMFVFSLAACSENQPQNGGQGVVNSIEKLVNAALSGESAGKIDLAKLSGFEWDRLFIYAPYTPASTIEKELRLVDPVVRDIGIDARDDVSLLVFMRFDQVAKAVAYPRGKGDFSMAGAENPIPRQRSRFIVVDSPEDKGWPQLEWVGAVD